jgi:biotin carboxyl carrier protein
MNQKELKELIDFLIEKDISEFELERGDVKVRIKRGVAAAPVIAHAVPMAMAPAPVQFIHSAASAASVPAAAAPPAAVEEELHMVKSPTSEHFMSLQRPDLCLLSSRRPGRPARCYALLRP